ncbi:2,5-diketo-D-gluconic acid reductase [Corynebacterium doosanense CAU 212 = DSM 45436]|uniref:2,5-diketo-D-gluconic acid reductase n=1 Tax=Corynebacterium doosanense CAU 212 = DSM 45436 TaxID=558173 RepID=A0A097IIG5_9CORY|nr:2,5-diketo-D-gluconic acid reductase [Corynebacterium doosanense CAU 212 = DSM 45436]
MMLLEQSFTLPTSHPIPRLGLGTWLIPDASVPQVIRDAVALSYRHIDTAQAYGNERGVGEGVRTCGVDRSELFVTTKVAASIKDYARAVASIDASLDALGLDYLDLLLIHSPGPSGDDEVWRAMEEALIDGRLRNIGVSNFSETDLRALAAGSSTVPHVNQIRVHPGHTPAALMDYCATQGIVVESYSPIGNGDLLTDPRLIEMAARYGVSVAQLCIRYTLQLGTVCLPKARSVGHLHENAEVDFEISEDDMATLSGLVIDVDLSGRD